MTSIYFAAPLFNDMEFQRNIKEAAKFERAGIRVFLPQRDSGEAFYEDTESSRTSIFNADLDGLCNSDVIVAYVDGRVPDEGTVFEMGVAYALGKKVMIVSTDTRSFMRGYPNVMVEKCGNWYRSTEEVIQYLKEAAKYE